MTSRTQQARSAANNSPPGSLLVGQFYVEMGTPLRMWVGVPTTIDPTGRRILLDGTYGVGPWLALSGGTMVGPLVLSQDPTMALGAAPKRYVDAQVATALPLAGGALTGPLILAADPMAANGAATKHYVDNNPPFGGPYLRTAGGALTGPLTLAADPTAALGAATKQYVDAKATGYLPLSGGTITGGLNVNGTLNGAGLVQGQTVYATGPVYGAAGLFAGANGDTSLGLYRTSGQYVLQFSPNWYWSWNTSSGLLSWIANGSNVFRLDIGGNGTFNGSVAASGNVTGSYIHTTGALMCDSGVFYVAGNTNYYLARNGSDGAWRFVENGTVNATIDTGGGISARGGIGAGGNISGGNVYAAGNVQAAGVVLARAGNTWLGPGGAGVALLFSPSWFLDWNSGNGTYAFNTPSGYIWIMRTTDWLAFNNIGTVGGMGAYYNASDARGKDAIADAPHGLDEVLKLRPVSFKRKRMPGDLRPPVTELGFVAQEMRRVVPEGVHVMGVKLPDGGGGLDSDEPSLGISLDPIVVCLVNAVKALAARLETLERKGT